MRPVLSNSCVLARTCTRRGRPRHGRRRSRRSLRRLAPRPRGVRTRGTFGRRHAAEFARHARLASRHALANRVPAGYEKVFIASTRRGNAGGGGGGGGDEDDDDVPHVRDPCHHPMCVVCNQRHSSYGPADGPRRRCATCRFPEDKCKNFSSLCSLCLEEGVTTHASYGPVGGTRERCMKHKKHDDEKKK